MLSLEKTATGTFLILGEKREFTYQEDGGFKQVGVEKNGKTEDKLNQEDTFKQQMMTILDLFGSLRVWIVLVYAQKIMFVW